MKKVIAMHLPQYHAIPENNKWWGEGFTDWDNVKKAKSLYKNHDQPLIPKDKKYYDMTDYNTLVKQSELAKEYGVYGFCYYHYWFNGKMLLEKPCEILLKNKEIDQNFCFCWANETWARTWDGKENDILIKQEFGGEKDWITHIKYLLDFFKDSRYIYVDNRPVMFFYSCKRIKKFNEMISFWNNILKDNGIKPIYVVEFINSFNNGQADINSDVLVEFQPHCAARYSVSNIIKAKRLICKKMKFIDFISYDYLWNKILTNKQKYSGKKLWKGAFVSFDNTPRKGYNGMITKGATPQKFEKYFNLLIKDESRNYVDDIIVINAWNEWAEGAVLEPTENNGFGYLEALKKALKESE